MPSALLPLQMFQNVSVMPQCATYSYCVLSQISCHIHTIPKITLVYMITNT